MQDPEVLEEFKVEAEEMLNESEDFLLNMEKGEDFEENFNGIFRAFHSLKGAAGMFEIDVLQSFMHQVETQFESLREVGEVNQEQIDYFLKAVDSARKIMDGEEPSLDPATWPGDRSNAATSSESEDAKQDQQQRVQERQQKEENKGKGEVVIVDDEEIIAEQLQEIVETHGYKATFFTNPDNAFEYIKAESPDLVCTDLKMPEMTGMQLLQKIRDHKVDTAVIFITGHVENKLFIEGMELGAAGFLEKPFETHQVISLANQAIKRAQTKKLLNRSLNYILYQFNDLDNYLKKEGKESLRENLRVELQNILKLRKEFQ